jgi:hypothetical protein
MLKPCIFHALERLWATGGEAALYPGTCLAKSIAQTKHLDCGCSAWPPQHVLVGERTMKVNLNLNLEGVFLLGVRSSG